MSHGDSARHVKQPRVLDDSPESLEYAAKQLASGQLVAFPTETVYGLGANAYDESAVRRIFLAKGRPAHNPLIVHVASWEQLALATCVDPAAPCWRRLQQLAIFWPGPLSVVVPRHPRLAPSVTAGLDSVAVRIPAHPVALALLRRCDFPVAAPSANPSNYVSPTTAEHVANQLVDEVSCILDGGPCGVGVESTIVSLLEDPPRILRFGGLPAEQIARQLQFPLGRLAMPPETAPRILAPGMLPEHYAPRTRLVIAGSLPLSNYPARVGLLAWSPASALLDEHPYVSVAHLSLHGNEEEVCRNLFARLREFDQLGLDLIVVEGCERTGLGRAIMDRLDRAAARG